ncbi:DNA cytosine methyltransferase [Ekhidna sp.]|uniref:DNA cytosine methyltransferase n=1 Tax=Ekhidna sp. TaxID=2608089 RepID=UPI003B5C740F
MHKVIDLFAGAGGFGLGFKLAGFNHIGSLEKDLWAVETLKYNNPSSTIIQSDIRTYIDKDLILDAFPENPDVLIGGPPCQGFSVAGPLKDPKDPRNSLFRFFSRWVGILKPPVFVMENVKGILTRRNSEGKYVHSIIEEVFKNYGYKVEIWKLNAVDYGVPQSRERVFFVGNIFGKSIGEPEVTHSFESHTSTKKFITVGQAISDLPVINACEGNEVQEYNQSASNEYQTWCRIDCNQVFNHVAMKHTSRLVERFKLIQQGTSIDEIEDKFQVRKRNGNGKLSNKKYNSNYRHLIENQVSYTIPAHFYSTFIHPNIPRNITAREAARIQSFPDSYIFKGKRTQISSKLLKKQGRDIEDNLSQYNQIGNAVPPLLAKAIAIRIQNFLDDQCENDTARNTFLKENPF